MKKDKDFKKLAVLEVIKEKKGILFGNFNNKLSHSDKQAAWTEVLHKAQSLQLVGADKTWTFARDNLFGLWKCRALAKRDNAKKTGTGGGKSKQPDEVDEAIYDILERDSVILDGLNLPETNMESVSILEYGDQSNEKDAPISPCTMNNSKTQIPHKRRKFSHPSSSPEMRSEMSKMKLELLRVETYYRKLQALKLERELGLPPSPITSEVCSFPLEESSGNLCGEDSVILFSENM